MALYWKILEKEVPNSIMKMFPHPKQQYERIDLEAPITIEMDAKMRFLRHKLPRELKSMIYTEAINKLELEVEDYKAAKKIIKKEIINRYPAGCYLQDCRTCIGLENDPTLLKRKKRKKKKKKSPPKPPCPLSCTCSAECKTKTTRLKFLYPNGIPMVIPSTPPATRRRRQRILEETQRQNQTIARPPPRQIQRRMIPGQSRITTFTIPLQR
jgi:hypothetical protein